MLDDFSQRLDDQLKDQPAVEATLRATIGNAYRQMERYDKAEPHLKAALDLRQRIFGRDSAEVADSLVDYAWCVGATNPAEKEKLAREALAIQRRLGLPENQTIRPLSLLASCLQYHNPTEEWDQTVAAIRKITSTAS